MKLGVARLYLGAGHVLFMGTRILEVIDEH
jgi:hypothetical protein